MYYMGLDKNNIPNGWDKEPWGDAIEVEDAVYDTASLHHDWYWNGTDLVPQPVPPPYVPSNEEIIASIQQAVQDRLDAVARLKNYDGILSACTYITSTHPTFAAEGQACVQWRDACWATCYQIMGEVLAGTRPIPKEAELLALLPVAPW